MGVLRKRQTLAYVPGVPGSPGADAYQVCTNDPPAVFLPPTPPDSGGPPQTCYQAPAQIVCDQRLSPTTGMLEYFNCRIYIAEICP